MWSLQFFSIDPVIRTIVFSSVICTKVNIILPSVFPPIIIHLCKFSPKLDCSRTAIAILVNGPSGINVISPEL